MRIHSKIASSTVNGPNDRAVIWVNGCSLGCAGCWNPDTHTVDANSLEYNVILSSWIIENAKEGVTFSGGEPMEQALGLLWVLKAVKRSRPDLSIGMYTGYTIKELETKNYVRAKSKEYDSGYTFEKWINYTTEDPWPEIKKHLDFAIMGRFNQQKLDSSTSLRSSTNQTLHLFSNRYKEEDFTEQQIEFSISDGMVQITGFPIGLNLESRDW